MKSKIILLTNFRSVFGNICIENIYNNNINCFVYVLSNNPYTLKTKQQKRKNFFSFLNRKKKLKNLSFLYHDRTISLLEELKMNYSIIQKIDSFLFKELIKFKPEAIILGDTPIISKECLDIAKQYEIPVINLHAAELPNYRGNYSTYAMVKDKQKLCMTYHKIDAKIDGGQILDKFFLTNELSRSDTYFTAERKLYIYGIKHFFENLSLYIKKAKEYIEDIDKELLAQVKIDINDRDKIKLNFQNYLEKVYNIKQKKLDKNEFVLNLLNKNTKKSKQVIKNSIDIDKITKQLFLEFEDDLTENDKKYGLFHVNASKVYKNILDIKNNIIYPANKKWCVILSHDVDIIPQSMDNIKKAFEIEKKYDVTSTYLLAALETLEKRHEYDPTYILDEPLTKELIYYIVANNHEIGLHGSFNSFNNFELLKTEKRRLESFIGMEIKSIRQHYLNFDRIKTPKTQNSVGFVIDSSLGFPTDVGIRTGYGGPFYFYDEEKKNGLSLLHIPYLIMDQNIMWNEKLENKSYKHKLDYFKALIKKAKKYNIPVILDWHLHTIELNEWWDIYEDILQYLTQDKTCAIMNMEQFYYSYSILNN